MPTYDYVCSGCDHRWEMFQPITAKAVRKCPDCGKLKAKRVIGPGAGIIFRGSGFYQTDYRSESYKKAARADQKPQEKSGGDGPSTAAEPKTKTDGPKGGNTSE